MCHNNHNYKNIIISLYINLFHIMAEVFEFSDNFNKKSWFFFLIFEKIK